MPNVLNQLGLQVRSRTELIDIYTTVLKSVYGDDIVLTSDSPDGQILNLIVQEIVDLQDLLVEIYNSFDPDNAFGVILDQRVSINGIQRQAGTYTIQPIEVVTTQSVNLYGLDQSIEDVYTVSDNAGNRWFLEDTQLGVTVGTHSYSFRAEFPGAQLTIPNTIDVPVTIVLGVASVNNPAGYTTLGINEEPDALLKVRRQRSVSLASQGYLAGLQAALENIPGVTSAFVYENNTNATDSDGIPAHSIWVIVAGTGDPAAIAQAIYTKRNAGAGMRGNETYIITQVDGSPFVVRWDDVITEGVFIFMSISSIDGIVSPDIGAIREALPNLLSPGVNESLNVTTLGALVQSVDPNAVVTQAGFSNGRSQTITFSPTPTSGTFKIRYGLSDTVTLNWNDSVATIQTAIRNITGLTLTSTTGSIASGLTIAFDPSIEAESLFVVVSNTMLGAGAVAVVPSYSTPLVNVIQPTTKQKQFVIETDNIVITPIQLNKSQNSISSGGIVQFAGVGGYGAYTYSFSSNLSGGSINATTGLYTAGVTTGVSDVIRVRDIQGHTVTSSIAVV